MPRAILNSWKEIASYLGCSVRTAQRWELELAMPVRHPRGGKRGPVLALAAEINAWLQFADLRHSTVRLTKPTERELPAASASSVEEPHETGRRQIGNQESCHPAAGATERLGRKVATANSAFHSGRPGRGRPVAS